MTSLDGVNYDGVVGWMLSIDDNGQLIRSGWHCDYDTCLDRLASADDIEDLIKSSDREWPDSIPHNGSYRDRNAMREWDAYLRALVEDPQAPAPSWFHN